MKAEEVIDIISKRRLEIIELGRIRVDVFFDDPNYNFDKLKFDLIRLKHKIDEIDFILDRIDKRIEKPKLVKSLPLSMPLNEEDMEKMSEEMDSQKKKRGRPKKTKRNINKMLEKPKHDLMSKVVEKIEK